jgi:hypothetical protein
VEETCSSRRAEESGRKLREKTATELEERQEGLQELTRSQEQFGELLKHKTHGF